MVGWVRQEEDMEDICSDEYIDLQYKLKGVSIEISTIKVADFWITSYHFSFLASGQSCGLCVKWGKHPTQKDAIIDSLNELDESLADLLKFPHSQNEIPLIKKVMEWSYNERKLLFVPALNKFGG